MPPPPNAPIPQSRPPSCAQELCVDGDRSCLHPLARALGALQAQHGAFRRVAGKGDAAAALAQLMARQRRELGADAPAVGAWARARVWV